MTLYMLDTNVISDFVKGSPRISQKITGILMKSLCISAITEGEIHFGLAKVPDAKKLHRAVGEILLRVDVMPWNHDVSEIYGGLRADLQRFGNPLGALDTLIAAHALQLHAVLVTHDQAFKQVPDLQVQDWAV